MKRSLLKMLLLVLPFWSQAQVVLENFEGAAKLPWNPIEGSFAVVDNPAGGDILGINTGGKVGAYTKKKGSAYSLFLAELSAPIDLTTNNQLRIMVKAPVATAFILKLEGTSAPIEEKKKIAVANQWVEYTFNLSAAADKKLNKILLFFDPGVDTSGATYLFDNIVLEPSGVCKGVAKNAAIWDDFECQRNVPLGLPGLTDLTAVVNPDKSGINTSAKVGRYKDVESEWHAMVMDYGENIPLDRLSQAKIKVWAPVAGLLLVKLEGGDSPAKEIPIQITELNKWVEYTIDFTSQAAAKHKKFVLFFNAGKLPGANDVYFIDDIRFEVRPSSIVLEDFEPTAKLPWKAADGAFALVDNIPGGDTLKLNASKKVGAYTKKKGSEYSLFIAELAQPLDLTIYNTLKIQIKSPVTTSFLLKLEGASGNIEEKKKIAVANQWVEYTFNFSSAAAKKDFNKVIIFFDPGTADSQDTYLLDNLIAVESGDCSGVAKNIEVLDDFDCQRNISYSLPGWDDVVAVKNPDPSSVNESKNVGKYKDTGGEWHALVVDYGANIPLGDRNVFKIKVWAPVAGNLLVKLEGGTSPAKEAPVAITLLNKWVEYKVDFSSEAGNSHKKLVLFFNAGKNPGANDVYYIDDMKLEAQPSGLLEDFEPKAKLAWETFGAEAVFGKFNGFIANPDKTGANTTTNVGSYKKGSSALGGVKSLLPTGFKLTDLPQLNLQVWAPAGAKTLTVRLNSASQGLKEVNRPITETKKWVDLSFNFDNFKSITDFETVEIIFDPALVAADTWYFDNLSQTKATVNPCEGTVPLAGSVDDFDCQRNAVVSTTGGNFLEVIKNPDASGINSSANDKVGKYNDPLDEWSAIVWDFGKEIDLSVQNQLKLKIWSPVAVPLMFKLEGGQQVEILSEVKAANAKKWVEYLIDFKGAVGKGNKKLVIFFNPGKLPAAPISYFLDDLEFVRAPYTGCISTFETPLDNLGKFQYFANGDIDGKQVDFVIDNPKKGGINVSNKVGEFIERPGGEIYAGMFATGLPATIVLPNNSKKISMKVWMDQAAEVVFKLERGVNGEPQTGDTKVKYTTPNQWQTLTWDFSEKIPDNAVYQIITLIMNFDNTPTAEKRYYFDDIAIGNSTCATATPTVEVNIDPLTIYPNPAADRLEVRNMKKVNNLVIYNALGQQQGIIQSAGQEAMSLDISHLQKGIYLLAGFSKEGSLISNARFMKE